MPDLKLFAGNAIPELAQKIADRLGAKLGDATVGRFSDGEVQVQINEFVRGCDVFIIQSTCAPTNDNLMELGTGTTIRHLIHNHDRKLEEIINRHCFKQLDEFNKNKK